MNYDIIIIGGGIVGLATAYQILNSKPDSKLLILEKENEIAQHQTGNNSGVIHSGIYYEPGSSKALNCRKGYSMLLDFCRENNVPYKLCGKIIVATDNTEIPYLDKIFENGVQNGLTQIKVIGEEEIKEIEPHSVGVKGIHVPEAGIVDYSTVAEKLAALIQEKGGEIRLGAKVNQIDQNLTVHSTIGDSKATIIVNCAGLYADKIALMTESNIPFRILPFRGEYYKLKSEKSNLVNGLIYPVPDPAFPFLGVHFTKKIDGSVEAGPNAVLAFRKEGYKKRQVHVQELISTLSYSGFRKIASKYWKKGLAEMKRSFSKSDFTAALKKLIPEITSEDLVKGGSGVRAQACDAKGNMINDFLFIEREGIIHVCNSPSPAATSCLAIGAEISSKVVLQLS